MSSEDADHDASGRRRSHAYAAEDEEDDPLGINSFNNGDDEVVPTRKARKAAAPKKPGLSQQTLSIINDLAPHTLEVPRPESESEEEAAAEERMREEEEAKRRHREKAPPKKPKKTRKKKEEPAEEEDRAFDHYVKILLLGDQGACPPRRPACIGRRQGGADRGARGPAPAGRAARPSRGTASSRPPRSPQPWGRRR